MARRLRLAAGALVALVLSLGPSVPVATPASLAMVQSTELRIETLLNVLVAGVPTGSAKVTVERWTLRPNSQILTIPAIDGLVFIVPESGAITASEAGTTHRLLLGEPFTPVDRHHQVNLRASGPKNAVAWVISLNSGPDNVIPRDRGGHTLARFVSYATKALPGGSGRLVLEQLTLPPGSALPPFEVSALMWMGIGEGTAAVILEGRTPLSWEPGRGRLVGAGQPWPYIPTPMANPLMAGGTRMTLRNASAPTNLIVYRLMFVPTGGGRSAASTGPGEAPLS